MTNPKGGSGKTTIATNLAAAFAAKGRRTWLADADRQHSSLGWLARRPATAPRIRGLDWGKNPGKTPNGKGVLIIDAPAAIKSKRTEELVARADAVVVPVLPSVFDQETTTAFLKRLIEIKPIRKNKKSVAVLPNRIRRNSRAAARLDLFMIGTGYQDLGGLPDRAIYLELAEQGLGLFDLKTKRGVDLQEDWQPLLRFIEGVE
ncbi:MAG: ParA family protein [Pseudomonadota bacterium]